MTPKEALIIRLAAIEKYHDFLYNDCDFDKWRNSWLSRNYFDFYAYIAGRVSGKPERALKRDMAQYTIQRAKAHIYSELLNNADNWVNRANVADKVKELFPTVANLFDEKKAALKKIEDKETQDLRNITAELQKAISEVAPGLVVGKWTTDIDIEIGVRDKDFTSTDYQYNEYCHDYYFEHYFSMYGDRREQYQNMVRVSEVKMRGISLIPDKEADIHSRERAKMFTDGLIAIANNQTLLKKLYTLMDDGNNILRNSKKLHNDTEAVNENEIVRIMNEKLEWFIKEAYNYTLPELPQDTFVS